METSNRPQMAQEFTDKIGAGFPMVEDDQHLSREVYGVTGTPTNMVIDRSGRIIFTSLGYGPGKEESYAAEIESLL